MRRVSATQLIPGMITAEDIFSYNDQLLIPNGTVLTDSAITILEMYDIISIRIKDAPVVIDETILSDIYSERIKNSNVFKRFKKDYDKEIINFRNSVQASLEKDFRLDTDELLEGTLALLDNVHTALGVFDMLHCMREYDDSTFAHCINVALICNVAARWLSMSENEIRLATSCGLFHDIGKLHVPKTILDKPAKLTTDEYDIIKQHPVSGYQLLRDQNVAMPICNAALMHHERCDGSGYPFRLKRAQIDRFAKLVSIVDVYDAMTAARVYRGPLCPFTVIALFEQEGLQKYDPRYIMTFLENVMNTYILNRCKLNDGREGTIVYINRDYLSRPTVQCDNEYINLIETPELFIESLL